MKGKRIIVSVTNDLIADQRVHKVCSSLSNQGAKVTLVGRKLNDNFPAPERNYQTLRFSLMVKRGILFYAIFNLRLFLFLLFSKADLLLSNDLDTLPANFIASKIRRIPLVYDSHEYFTEVPELVCRPKVQAVWQRIEEWILPKLTFAYTASSQIANEYFKKYNVQFKVIRNFPVKKASKAVKRENFIIYQGALNVGRGLEELIQAMQFVEGYQLLIIGAGDIEADLKKLSNQLNLQACVVFKGKLPFEQLVNYTSRAKLGLSLEHKLGLNYEYALPNKIFDYLHAAVPVLYSDLMEVDEVLRPFEVGEKLKSRDPKKLAAQIKEMLESDKHKRWSANCKIASEELNWQNEEIKLFSIINASLIRT